jgi:glycosyltransferase involved in cell wall biosynthesis
MSGGPAENVKGKVAPDRGNGSTLPALSVVIASVNGYRYIAQCLSALERQHLRQCAEVIVVEGSGDDTVRRISEEYPWATVIALSAPRSIPELRSLGIRRAKADIVVTTEDHCVFEAHWYERILQAHQMHPHPAIGGAVENGSCQRLVDWAAYICEYGKFMLPFAPGPGTDLPGPNVSYKRDRLEQACGDLLDRGVWENVLHDRLGARGMELWMDPSIVVHHAKVFGFWEFLGQRYYFGRSFAATRVARASLATRVFFTVLSPLLPPLFLWRYAKFFIGKRRFIKELLVTSPLLVLFAVAWSVGEFLGYARGDGGSSLRVK